MANVEINQAQLAEVNRLLANIRNGTSLAIRRSLTRTVAGTKTQIAQELIKKVTLKSSYIKSQINSSVTGLTGRVSIYGDFTPLAKFTVNPAVARLNVENPNGLTVKVYKDGSTVRFKHAFWAIMKNGHIGVFERRAKSSGGYVGRLAIDELVGPTLTSVYENTPDLSQRIESTAADRLARELIHQVDYILSQHT